MILYDKHGNPVEVDDYAHGVWSTDHVHGMIHKGKFFSVVVETQSLANNGYLNLLVIPSAIIHCQLTAFSGGDGHVQWWKSPTYTLPSPNGLTTPINHNDGSTKTPDVLCYQDPSVSDPGTAWRTRLPIFGGTGGVALGANLSFTNERILAAGTEYLIRLQNTSGQVNDSHLLLYFYQPTA